MMRIRKVHVTLKAISAEVKGYCVGRSLHPRSRAVQKPGLATDYLVYMPFCKISSHLRGYRGEVMWVRLEYRSRENHGKATNECVELVGHL